MCRPCQWNTVRDVSCVIKIVIVCNGIHRFITLSCLWFCGQHFHEALFSDRLIWQFVLHSAFWNNVCSEYLISTYNVVYPHANPYEGSTTMENSIYDVRWQPIIVSCGGNLAWPDVIKRVTCGWCFHAHLREAFFSDRQTVWFACAYRVMSCGSLRINHTNEWQHRQTALICKTDSAPIMHAWQFFPSGGILAWPVLLEPITLWLGSSKWSLLVQTEQFVCAWCMVE